MLTKVVDLLVADTLSSYPYVDKDPFVIDAEHFPEICFAGNQSQYASELVQVSGQPHRTLLVNVPSFYYTRQAVLVNLTTLSSEVISFQELLGPSHASGEWTSVQTLSNPLSQVRSNQSTEDRFVIDFSENMEES